MREAGCGSQAINLRIYFLNLPHNPARPLTGDSGPKHDVCECGVTIAT